MVCQEGETYDRGIGGPRCTTGREPAPDPAGSGGRRDRLSVFLITALVLWRISVPAHPADVGAWLADPGDRATVAIALNLVPFAGIAFLWFIGVLRDPIGEREDRFFATVFLGTSLLFVAMMFVAVAVAVAVAGATIAGVSSAPLGADCGPHRQGHVREQASPQAG